MTCLITGSTGLIGAALVRRFAADGHAVVAAARNVEKAKEMFAGLENVRIVEWDVTRPVPAVLSRSSATDCPVDWLVHAASETSSRAFVEDPDGVRRVIVEGTRNVLAFAKAARVKSMVYLSTFEVMLGLKGVRASYPDAKFAAEGLCRASGLNVSIARLAQTFGEGVRYDDGRVFAEFARAILEKRDIVLKTEGTTARCYCYLGDAVEAIRILLEKGVRGEAYTVANEGTYCTIREMAEMLIAAHPESGSKLVIDTADAAARGFAPPFQMKLDSSPLRALGWQPQVGLVEMYDRMMAGMQLRTAAETSAVRSIK